MEPENENFGQKLKRKTKSFLKKVLIAVVLIGTLTMVFLHWFTYDNGLMSGKVLRISEKGFLFKTYEGKLNLETFGALKGASPIAESFDFSVKGSDEETVTALQEVALSGERVNVHYKKYLATFPWRGETKVFVYKVERSKQ